MNKEQVNHPSHYGGRYLEPNEEVHHKNGVRNDNSKENR